MQNLLHFELPDEDLNVVRSEDLEGWLLWYWYPKADTPGCIAQAESIRDNFESFRDMGCQVLGSSFDAPEQNRSFRDKYRLPFRLLSDEDGSTAVRIDAARDGDPYPQRVAFLIDPDHRIVRRYDVENPSMFAETVLADLETIIDAGE